MELNDYERNLLTILSSGEALNGLDLQARTASNFDELRKAISRLHSEGFIVLEGSTTTAATFRDAYVAAQPKLFGALRALVK